MLMYEFFKKIDSIFFSKTKYSRNNILLGSTRTKHTAAFRKTAKQLHKVATISIYIFFLREREMQRDREAGREKKERKKNKK